MDDTMKLHQNDQERIIEAVRQGEMTPDEANVSIVRTQRVLLVTSRLPAEVRGALNAAVKRKELGHVRKDGLKPEAYYHPKFEHLVAAERNRHAEAAVKALQSVMARPGL